MSTLDSNGGNSLGGSAKKWLMIRCGIIKGVLGKQDTVAKVAPIIHKRSSKIMPEIINFESMKSESERLMSFEARPRWPVSFINPVDLAKAGLFSMHRDDKVQCAYCRGILGEWRQGDVPIMEHERAYPRCPFVMSLSLGNVHTGEDTNRDIDNLRGHHNKYMSEKICRLNSFQNSNWPTNSGLTAETLSTAGFYYTKEADYVKCFSCGGGLYNWSPTDDPWTEHKKWFPDCEFIRSHAEFNAIVRSPEVRPAQESTSVSSASARQPEPEWTMPTTVSGLRKELRKLRDARRCKNCKNREATVVFLPCGHMSSCSKCATTSKQCGECQLPVKAFVRTFS